MKQTPLFSTYSQGENRVTGSMLAVFERIDHSLMVRLLGAASGESELQMLSFKNQVSGDGSVPDAGIKAHFNYLFEVKTVRQAVNGRQLQTHLGGLEAQGDEYLFVVTPDADEPAEVEALKEQGEPVRWFSFVALSAAIRDLLTEPDAMVFQHEELLLRELVRLFDEDGLLRPPLDVAIVSGSDAYAFYKEYGLYACQTDRSFRADTAYLGFYSGKQVQPEFPLIRWHGNHVPVSRRTATDLVSSDDPGEREVGAALLAAMDGGHFGGEEEFQIFLLAGSEDERTLVLPHPIEHVESGSWMPFGGQRPTASETLRRHPKTTKELKDDAPDA